MNITRERLLKIISEEINLLLKEGVDDYTVIGSPGGGFSEWCNYGIPNQPIRGGNPLRGPKAEYRHHRAWASQLNDGINYFGLSGTTDEKAIIDALKEMVCAYRIGNTSVGQDVAYQYFVITDGSDLGDDIRGEWSIAGVPSRITAKLDELGL